MAARVRITTESVHRALHTKGGVVQRFDKKLGEAIEDRARRTSPVNDPRNAMHRERWGSSQGPPGEYRASWTSRNTTGSNRHTSRVLIENTSAHAIFVEEGRGASTKYQVFTWTHAPYKKMARGERPFKRPGWKWWLITAGGENSLLKGTGWRPGKHILGRATQKACAKFGIAFHWS